MLIGADELDEKKKLFAPDQFSVHIYSLSPAPLKVSCVIYPVTDDRTLSSC